MTLDYYAHVVYWMDNCDFSLRSVEITPDQLNSNFHISLPSKNRVSSLGITLFEDIIYWTGQANVYGVNRTTGTNTVQIVRGSISHPFVSLKVVHPNNQPNGESTSVC